MGVVLEVAAFPAAKDSAAIEVYTFVPEARGNRGGGAWLLTVVLRDEHGHVLGEASRVEPIPGEESPPVTVWHFRAGAGGVRVRVRAENLETGDRSEGDAALLVPDFRRETPWVSTPVFGVLPGGSDVLPPGILPRRGILPVDSHRVLSATDTVAVLLTLDDRRTIPDVRWSGLEDRSGGRLDRPGVALADSFHLRAVLLRGSRVERDTSFAMPRSRSEWLLREPAGGLPGGDYKLQLTVSLGDQEVRRAVEFRIAVGGSDFLSDPLRVRTVLTYVATREERMALEVAGEDSMAALWIRFWARRDPTPRTERNEARDLFMGRVDAASRRFGGVVPGWRTDQGRIFIRHGRPDRVDRVPAQGSRPARETWTYDEGNANYVFEDLDGFGTLRLTGGFRD
jgi:GWxTD domain-containing protein